MFESFRPYLLTFIPLFVAVDAIGNIPVFVSLVEGLNKKQKAKAISDSVITAALIAIVFMFVGKLVLNALNITIQDFQIAGGALLFIIAAKLLLPGSHKVAFTQTHDKDVGVFPLGTPLITGPAVLATTLILLDTHGVIPTFVSLVLNMLITWVCLIKADFVMRVMGNGGTRAFAKIMYILLAAIGAMMIRHGIMGIFIK